MIEKKLSNLPKGTWAICEEELKLLQVKEQKVPEKKDNFDLQWPLGLSLPKNKDCDKKE